MAHHFFQSEFSLANSKTGVSDRFQSPIINATGGAQFNVTLVNRIIRNMEENKFLQIKIVCRGGNNLRSISRRFQGSRFTQRRELLREIEYLIRLIRRIAEASMRFDHTEVIICSLIPSPATQFTTEPYFVKLHTESEEPF